MGVVLRVRAIEAFRILVGKYALNGPQLRTMPVENRLRAALPLAGKTEAQAEASLQAYLSQDAGGTKEGADVGDILNHICQMASNGNWSEAGTQRLVETALAGWAGKKSESTAGSPTTPKEPLEVTLAKSCKQSTDGLNQHEKSDRYHFQSVVCSSQLQSRLI